MSDEVVTTAIVSGAIVWSVLMITRAMVTSAYSKAITKIEEHEWLIRTLKHDVESIKREMKGESKQ